MDLPPVTIPRYNSTDKTFRPSTTLSLYFLKDSNILETLQRATPFDLCTIRINDSDTTQDDDPDEVIILPTQEETLQGHPLYDPVAMSEELRTLYRPDELEQLQNLTNGLPTDLPPRVPFPTAPTDPPPRLNTRKKTIQVRKTTRRAKHTQDSKITHFFPITTNPSLNHIVPPPVTTPLEQERPSPPPTPPPPLNLPLFASLLGTSEDSAPSLLPGTSCLPLYKLTNRTSLSSRKPNSYDQRLTTDPP